MLGGWWIVYTENLKGVPNSTLMVTGHWTMLRDIREWRMQGKLRENKGKMGNKRTLGRRQNGQTQLKWVYCHDSPVDLTVDRADGWTDRWLMDRHVEDRWKYRQVLISLFPVFERKHLFAFLFNRYVTSYRILKVGYRVIKTVRWCFLVFTWLWFQLK